MNSAEVADGIRFEMHGAFQDLPVHTGFTLPDFDGLFLRQVVAQAVPRGSADVGHGFDEMSHENDSFGCKPA
jgi:hypothetical protein